MESLARRIAAARVGAGLSQAGLAKHVHLSQSDISKFENGHKEPGLDTLRGIATATDKSLSYFIEDHTQLRASSLGELVDRLEDALGENVQRDSGPPYAGVQELLADGALCEKLKITDPERKGLSEGIAWPRGPANIDEAIQVLHAMRSCSAKREERSAPGDGQPSPPQSPAPATT